MSAYTVQAMSLSGLDVTFAEVTSEDTFLNDGRTFLVVKNGGTGSIDVTIDSVVPCSYGFDHDVVVAVPSGEERWIGVFPTGRFNSNGVVTITYSEVTNVTATVVKL